MRYFSARYILYASITFCGGCQDVPLRVSSALLLGYTRQENAGEHTMNEPKTKKIKNIKELEDIFEDYHFTNQNWIRVLDEIWQYAPNKWGRGAADYNDNHLLAKRLKISGHELMLIMMFLNEQKLTEYDPQFHNTIELTPKGFDVALQNRNAMKNEKISKGSLVLSLAIAIFAVISAYTGIENNIEKWLITSLFAVALIIGGYFINKI